MKINIDLLNYHIGKESKQEKTFIRQVLSNIKNKDNKLFINISNEYLSKIVKAIIMENYDEYSKLQEEDVYSDIYKKLKEILPIISDNEKEISLSRCKLYEPKIALTLHNINHGQDVINNTINNYKSDEQQYILLLNNVLRSSKSILILISLGDDAHGMALFRGMLEQLCKLLFINEYDCFKDYILFNKMNCELQMLKNGNILQTSKEFNQFIDKYKLSVSNAQTENFLLYQWMKIQNKTISNATELISLFFNESPNVLKLYHIACEFVHEDYVGINYDWYGLRKFLGEFIYSIFGDYNNIQELLDEINK